MMLLTGVIAVCWCCCNEAFRQCQYRVDWTLGIVEAVGHYLQLTVYLAVKRHSAVVTRK